MQKILINTSRSSEMVDITKEIQRVVVAEGAGKGICHLFVPHTTAGLTINEGADPSVREDILQILERLIPRQGPYRHLEGNAAAHIKTSLLGSSLAVFIQGGRLSLGAWQSIYLCEFDGPRRREVWVMFSPV